MASLAEGASRRNPQSVLKFVTLVMTPPGSYDKRKANDKGIYPPFYASFGTV